MESTCPPTSIYLDKLLAGQVKDVDRLLMQVVLSTAMLVSTAAPRVVDT